MYNRYVFGGCALIGFLIGGLFGTGALATFTSVLVVYHLYLAFLIVRTERNSHIKLSFVGRTFLIHLACLVPLVGLVLARPYIPVFAVIRLLTLGLAIAEAKWLFQSQTKLAAAQTARMIEKITGSAAATPSIEIPATAVVPASSFAVASAESPVAGSVAATVPKVPLPTVALPAVAVPAEPLPIANAASAPAISVPAVLPPAPVEALPVAAYAVVEKPAPYVPVATFSFAETKPSAPLPVYEGGDDYDDFVKHMQQGKRPFRKPGVTVKQEFELWLAARRQAMSRPAPQPSALGRLLQVSRTAE